MSSNVEGKKWIQTSVAIACMLLGYVLMSFFEQLNDWFSLEATLNNYSVITQVLCVLIGIATFVVLMKNPKSSLFLEEVFQEAVKVVWPNKNDTVKHTIGIMIAVGIIGMLLGIFDIGAGYLLSLINK